MRELDFYEVVTVLENSNTKRNRIANMEGIVVGKAAENGVNYYSISIDGMGHYLTDADIRPTGRRVERSTLYSGEVIHVDLNGNIVSDE